MWVMKRVIIFGEKIEDDELKRNIIIFSEKKAVYYD